MFLQQCPCENSSWCNCTGSLGVKHQVTYLPCENWRLITCENWRLIIGGNRRHITCENWRFITVCTHSLQEHEYILKPINSQARVKRFTSALPLRSAAKPRITVDLSLDTMAFCLATSQYRSLLLWHREFSRHSRRRLFAKFRPTCPVTNKWVLQHWPLQLGLCHWPLHLGLEHWPILQQVFDHWPPVSFWSLASTAACLIIGLCSKSMITGLYCSKSLITGIQLVFDHWPLCCSKSLSSGLRSKSLITGLCCKSLITGLCCKSLITGLCSKSLSLASTAASPWSLASAVNPYHWPLQ